MRLLFVLAAGAIAFTTPAHADEILAPKDRVLEMTRLMNAKERPKELPLVDYEKVIGDGARWTNYRINMLFKTLDVEKIQFEEGIDEKSTVVDIVKPAMIRFTFEKRRVGYYLVGIERYEPAAPKGGG